MLPDGPLPLPPPGIELPEGPPQGSSEFHIPRSPSPPPSVAAAELGQLLPSFLDSVIILLPPTSSPPPPPPAPAPTPPPLSPPSSIITPFPHHPPSPPSSPPPPLILPHHHYLLPFLPTISNISHHSPSLLPHLQHPPLLPISLQHLPV
ncbi:hypothetical protein BDN67DRAFT_1017259 [Paxillus ammoniavirescens]|nr:hypothetical protein BDN67DRAFT_1017259 [Paxillus ammoniavirescens]